VFEHGLLVIGVQKLEEIFRLARTTFFFTHKILGVGSKDMKFELLERRIFCGFSIYCALVN